jgi:DNA polymerase elongation subunit (family B)
MEKPVGFGDSFTSPLTGARIHRVPVLHVLGASSPSLVNSCVHIHGYLPYFYLETSRGFNPCQFNQPELELAESLEKIAEFKTPPLIHDIEFVLKTSFYGYHAHPEYFVKVSVYEPRWIKKLVNMLHVGKGNLSLPSFIKLPCQAYEAHIPYSLSFCADYSLRGMDLIRLKSCAFRQRSNVSLVDDVVSLSSLRVVPLTKNAVEMDCCVEDIEIIKISGELEVESLQSFWDVERAFRLDKGLSSQGDMSLELERISRLPVSDLRDKISETFRRKLADLVSRPLDQDSFGELIDQDDVKAMEILRRVRSTVLATEEGSEFLFDENDLNRNDCEDIMESQESYLSCIGQEESVQTETETWQSSLQNLMNDIATDDSAHVGQLEPFPDNSQVDHPICVQNSLDAKPSLHTPLHFSDIRDAPEKPTEYGGKQFFYRNTSIPERKDKHLFSSKLILARDSRLSCELPPSHSDSAKEVSRQENRLDSTGRISCASTKTQVEDEFDLSVLSLECITECSDQKIPDPAKDAIVCICIKFCSSQREESFLLHLYPAVEPSHLSDINRSFCYDSELSLLSGFVNLLRELDPDLICGFEVQKKSLGFVSDRYTHLNQGTGRLPLCSELSRFIDNRPRSALSEESAQDDDFLSPGESYERNHGAGIKISGRIVLNLWRIFRSEIKIPRYSFEVCVEHVMGHKTAFLEDSALFSLCLNHGNLGKLSAFNYMLNRNNLNISMIKAISLVSRTSELARLYGIQFYEVLSRGSQFRVESIMVRMTRQRDMVLLSPSPEQVRNQDAMECIPLILEPKSAVYIDPIVVFDFQSLYPSIIISRNICYSTCLGKIFAYDKASIDTQGYHVKTGSYELYVPFSVFEALKDKIWIAPNGTMFVLPSVRPGVLPKMLQEILETRVMLKKSMKRIKKDKDSREMERLRALDSQQFGLKMIANVTYGYTSAGFSGRMPSADIADAIVQTARETLEAAIETVEKNKEWKAEVVYGDTDSLFVKFEGATREEAFALGKEIADTITSMNPEPMKLKMEKVFHPSIMIAKKRYVGYAYESEDQKDPKFDDKGIETVRRDGCPLLVETMEKSIRLIFNKDLSKLRRYLERTWIRVLKGFVPLDKFIFAKEVRIDTYSGMPPPAAIVAMKKMKDDPRSEPLYKERVPYVVVFGEPGSRLVDLVIRPEDLLRENHSYLVNSLYYIQKQLVPAINRITNLLGIDVSIWFDNLPRVRYMRPVALSQKSYRIDQYYEHQICPVCKCSGGSVDRHCDDCARDSQRCSLMMMVEMQLHELEIMKCQSICRRCTKNSSVFYQCSSTACEVMFRKHESEMILRVLYSKDPFLRQLAVD